MLQIVFIFYHYYFAYKEAKHVLEVLGSYHTYIFQNGDFKYFQVATTPLTGLPGHIIHMFFKMAT